MKPLHVLSLSLCITTVLFFCGILFSYGGVPLLFMFATCFSITAIAVEAITIHYQDESH